jgi:hypothetical protein
MSRWIFSCRLLAFLGRLGGCLGFVAATAAVSARPQPVSHIAAVAASGNRAEAEIR